MTDQQSSGRAILLAIFHETYEAICTKGTPVQGGSKRISSYAARSDAGVLELGKIGHDGIMRPFARVNGSARVEPVGRISEERMKDLVKMAAEHIERCTPCHGETGLYHHSVSGPRKVF